MITTTKKGIPFFYFAFLFCKPAMGQVPIDSNKNYSYHFQLTIINQGHPAFAAKYSGANSLSNNAENNKLSLTTTLFLGRKLWKNGSIYFNPEIAGGTGLSSVKGIAGFTNGETFRIGTESPKLYIGRLYIKQYFPLKNTGYKNVENGINQIVENVPTSHISLVVGKFCMSDFFDNNAYSHDPRSQFMNWALMSNGAWDYPADTRGYTQGFVAELAKPFFAIRASSVLVPTTANGLQLDYYIAKAHSETIEIEKDFKTKRPWAVRILFFRAVSQAPTYSTTLAQVKMLDSSSVPVYTGAIEWHKYGGVKYGFGINAEQEISNTAGIFFKASWNDGKTATWAFTEIDKSLSAGINIKGNTWKRPSDNIGIAALVNGISTRHQAFLNAGLYGFIIGDGKLNYGAEAIVEIYYQAKITKSFFASVDYQFVNNPAYNKDRGPLHVFAIRGHVSF